MNNKKGIGNQVANFATKRPILTTILSFLMAFGVAVGAGNLKMSSDYRYFFGKDNPQLLAFERIQNVYSKDDSVLIAINHKTGNVFTPKILSVVKDLTKRSWKTPYSTRVDSITNFQHTKANEDDLVVEDLVLNPESLSMQDLKYIETTALNEPLLKNRLISSDSKTTAINITIALPGKSPKENPEVAKFVRELVSEFQAKNPDLEFRLSGVAMLNNAFNEAGIKDMTTLTPIMYALILGIMFLMLRSFSAVFATLCVIILSVVTAMGSAGYIGIPITPPSSIAPTVIVTLAIADSIHILKGVLLSLSRGLDKKDAIIESLKSNFKPVFLTSFTTAIGFLSLNFSDTPPFHDLGNITAVGVIAAFIYSVTLLPALTLLLPIKAKKLEENNEKKWQIRFSSWVHSNKKAIIYVTLFLTTFLAIQVPKIELNDQFVKYFDKSVKFRTDSDYVLKNLTGLYQSNFDFISQESGGISNPEYLNRIERFSDYLKAQKEVVHVSTITDTFKRINKSMHGDSQEYYKLPDTREMAAQYLLLYEMSLPYGLDINNQIDVDKSSTRVVVTFEDMKTKRFLDLNHKYEKWVQDNFPAHLHTKASSPTIMFSHISERNVKAMAWGTLVAFSLITLILIISMKSIKYGLISLIPNMIPTILAYGLWSLFVGEAGFAIAIVSSVTIGIVVDDTVHFLAKYVKAKNELNLSSSEAIEYSFSNVGGALVITSIILAIGFAVLMLSPFKVNWILGALSALTITLALVVDFLFLPALLSLFDEKKVANNNIGEKMKINNVLTSLVIMLIAGGLSSQVNASNDKGLWIANQIDKTNEGFVNQIANIKMTLSNKHGQKSTRQMKVKTLEVANDGDKSLTVFSTPRDLKGSAFLSFSHAIQPDDQWLYLSSLKRVKRISSNNKSGPFMGSEFAYEDISSQEVEKYTYKFIKDEKVNGFDGVVFERYPVDSNSGYTKQVVWADSKEWRIYKIEFYDRKGDLLKTLTYNGYKKYKNGKWRPDEMFMQNHQNGKTTLLSWSDYQFNQNISEKDFNKNALKRVGR